jgi:hypothetical protein
MARSRRLFFLSSWYSYTNIKGEEWFIFREWVASLPEIQRAIHANDGAYVDMTGRQLLYNEPECHEFGFLLSENFVRDGFVEGVMLEDYLPKGSVLGGPMPMPERFEPDSSM